MNGCMRLAMAVIVYMRAVSMSSARSSVARTRQGEAGDDGRSNVVELADVESWTAREEGGGRVEHVFIAVVVVTDVVVDQAWC